MDPSFNEWITNKNELLNAWTGVMKSWPEMIQPWPRFVRQCRRWPPPWGSLPTAGWWCSPASSCWFKYLQINSSEVYMWFTLPLIAFTSEVILKYTPASEKISGGLCEDFIVKSRHWEMANGKWTEKDYQLQMFPSLNRLKTLFHFLAILSTSLADCSATIFFFVKKSTSLY